MNERLEQLRRFQKCLRRATEASTPGEAEAAEAAARRLMDIYNIDTLKITDNSLYDYASFSDNALLIKLREERRAMLQQARKQRRRQKPTIRFEDRVVVTPELLKKIHAMLRSGAAPVDVRNKFGLTKGQIAGIKGRYDQVNSHVQDARHQQAAPASAWNADDGGAG